MSTSGIEAPFFLLGGDGWKGLPDKGPFDAIHVGAAAEGTYIIII
jgi:protein-L-isoaspartate O-methyltransferase